jgi:DNA-binding transcriptional LysR family regulator
MLDVRRLRVLREVANQGSFSAAADLLHLSQSAVSQQVATLEREVGMPLLERTSAGPKLTEAGETLVGHADVVLARLEDAERELARLAGLEGGRVRLASFPTASATLVTRAVSAFRHRYPNVELELAEAEQEDSLPGLRRGDHDIAMAHDFPLVNLDDFGSDLERHLILQERMEVALPRGHPLAASEAIRLEQLAEESWLCGVSRGSCRHHVLRLCQRAGFDPRISFESDDYQVQQGLVAAGLGVALIPELAMTAPHPGVELRAVAPESPVRRVWAVTREAKSLAPATEAMLAVLREEGQRFASEGANRLAA